MMNDRTSAVEREVSRESRPRFAHLVKMFLYAFSSAKGISCIYLGVFVVLSLIRPALAFIWGRYIETAGALTPGGAIIPAALLLLAYFAINFVTELIDRYVTPGEQIERLDIVQANRQQELMHSKMFEKLAGLSPEYLEVPKINDNVEQVFKFVGDTWDGMNIKVVLQSYIVIAKCVSVASIAAALYIFNPWLCLMVLVAPLPSLWSLTLGQKLRFRFVKRNMALTRRIKYFQDLLLSPAGKELKTLDLHNFFYAKWKALADEYTLKEKKLIRAETALQAINALLASVASVGGSVLAIVLMAAGRLSLGALGAVMSLVTTLASDVKALISGFATLLGKKREAAQFDDLIALPSEAESCKACQSVESVEARGLKYRYPMTDRYVLNGVDLTIRKGEKVAFVGENGMGKTTMVKLITGALAPSGGELLINGEPAGAGMLESLSAVTQNPAKYTTFTVADNVLVGDSARERDEREIDAALEFSGFGGAEKDALLGKDIGGTELSGGQWQKLAIARAAYRGRDFILLDEPTGSLDPLAETEVFKKYIELAGDKTVIFVTHRISVASLADRIIVFSGGVIAQDGTHGDLIAQQGEYSRLYIEQAKWYDR